MLHLDHYRNILVISVIQFFALSSRMKYTVITIQCYARLDHRVNQLTEKCISKILVLIGYLGNFSTRKIEIFRDLLA